MAVFVQKMIEGSGGVIYTNGKNITITAGSPAEKLTAGTEEKPHKIVINKKTGEVIKEELSLDNMITREQIEQLTELARQIEEVFGQPQDIEWVIDPEGNICILQARPLF